MAGLRPKGRMLLVKRVAGLVSLLYLHQNDRVHL